MQVIETVRFWLLVGVLVTAGCYRPPSFERCEVACSGAEACPEGSTCLVDGFCHGEGDGVADCVAIDAGSDGGGGAAGSAIATGGEHTCAVLGDGRLACWGRNNRGQLGFPIDTRTATPTILDVSGVSAWTTVALGNYHSCAITDGDAALWCWGNCSLGECGDGQSTPIAAPTRPITAPQNGWSAVAPGGVHTCGIASGRLYCWGGNGYDQLGLSSNDDPVLEPTEVDGEASWTVIAAGNFHTCGIRSGGRLFCWGSNDQGKLGVGDQNPRDVPTEVDMGGMTWRTVAAGLGHTCGIRDDGSLWCWGYSGGGQTGGPSSDVPMMVDSGPWRDVVAATGHSCAVSEADELYCWGDDGFGARGDGLGDAPGVLVEIGTGLAWASVARGGLGDHACARTTDGDFYCWGDAGNGQVGDGELVDEHAPQQVPGGAGWTAIAGGGDQTCGVRGADLLCWGGYYLRQADIQVTPVEMTGGTGWTDVAIGREHGCAIDGAKHLWCWGDGADGELGNGANGYEEDPVAIEVTREWLDVTVGAHHTCAIEEPSPGASAGSVWCWGANFDLQIRASGMGSSNVPVQTLAPADFDEISAGVSHTCAHRNGDNELYCWGGNDDSQTSSPTSPTFPEAMVPDAGWQRVGVGAYHSCGILVGDVHCWGDNDTGQLGRATGGGNFTLHALAAHTGEWRGVTGGLYHACAIEITAPDPDELWCWGENDDGELGVAQFDGYLAPVQVGAATDWQTVAAGSSHTCAIDGGGFLWCWGDNNLGQLGDGESNRYEPTPVAPAEEL